MGPERWREVTEWVVIGNAALLIAYTAAARVLGGNDATISAVLADGAHRWPVVALGIGLVIGHIFWPVR